MVELRRASPSELRSALLRVQKRLPPSNTSGLEDVLGQGGEAPPDGTSLLLTSAQFPGAGAQAARVAMESVGRTRPSSASRMKYKFLLSNGAGSMGKALEYFRRAAKQTDNPFARAVANEREFFWEAMRILFTPYAPSGKGLAAPTIRPEGRVQTLAALRTLSRMAMDAARIETPFLRVSDARYGHLMKYNMPASKGPQLPAIATQPPAKQDGPSGPPKEASAENNPAGRATELSRPRGRTPRASRKTRGGQEPHRSRCPRRPPTSPSAERACVT